MTFSEFKEKGRFGCPADYDFFQKELEALLKKVHGSAKYVGKVPQGRQSKPVYQNELMRLKNQF